MQQSAIGEAISWLEKANSDLEPQLLGADAARALLADYARAEKFVSYGKAMLAHRLDDATEVARAGGTSMGEARATVETARALAEADPVRDASRAATSPWTRQARSPGRSEPVRARPRSCCRPPN